MLNITLAVTKCATVPLLNEMFVVIDCYCSETLLCLLPLLKHRRERSGKGGSI